MTEVYLAAVPRLFLAVAIALVLAIILAAVMIFTWRILSVSKEMLSLLGDTTQPQRCGECGERILNGQAYCPNCGARLPGEDE